MWQPISRGEFEELMDEQKSQLTVAARDAFMRFCVPLNVAFIQRSETVGLESVFVVASSPNGILYFDDVEYGFSFSPVDKNNRIDVPGGSQMMLADAVETWLVPQMTPKDDSPQNRGPD